MLQTPEEIIHGQHHQEIKDCITLLRNLTQIPTARPIGDSKNVIYNQISPLVKNTINDEHNTQDTETANRQNLLLWNLFSQGLDTVILNLIVSPHRDHW